MTAPTCTATEFPYLHGFSATEQARLARQARLAESTVFHDIDYSGVRRLLEVGSGVGAQTEILLRRFPDLHATCIDLIATQVAAARENLGGKPWLEGRATSCTRAMPPACHSSRGPSTRPSCAGCWSTCQRHRTC